ncbi:replication-associated recombination protein A [bacterium]|nr:MAG: replication-associated recombination protein A [bacterium]
MNLFADEDFAPPSRSAPRDETLLPLAARMRPRNLNEFAGQSHLVGPSAPLRRALERDRLPSSIFFGPAGTGKTTLARLLATLSKSHFEEFSAIGGSVADVRKIAEGAKIRHRNGKRTLLFVDEIHRFNRAQQDAFLPHVEDGTLVLIGATTENPLASLNGPLLSRCRMWKFEPLSEADVMALLNSALSDERGLGNLRLKPEAGALEWIARASRGDARLSLGALEMSADLAQNGVLTLADVKRTLGADAFYDKSGDDHYDTISAFIKSIRGSDPDAALFWMMRMLDGGEDPMFVARRLVIAASEDIGNAEPRALPLAVAALGAVEKVGMPECAIPLAQATTFLASAPKSNASYQAMKRARSAAQEGQSVRVPPHLRSTALGGSKEKMGNGEGYLNPHEFGGFVPQDYLPPGFKRSPFYEPTNRGEEPKIARRLEEWWGDDFTSFKGEN